MGGHDIFRSTLENDNWTVPVNMGFPINTPADDIYFTMTEKYNRGYYSSSNLSGNGDMDLYRITFSDERDPVAQLMGLVKKGGELVPAKSKITLTTLDGKETISQATDTLIGDYFLLLGHGKTYTMTVETEGFAPYTKEFSVPEQKEYFQLFQEVHHVHLTDAMGNIVGQQITVFNATGEERSTKEYYSEETIRKINNIKGDQDIDGDILTFSDVKFYIPEDSLRTMMAKDPDLTWDFDENVEVSFLKSLYQDPFDPGSYMEFPSADRNELFAIRKLLVGDDDIPMPDELMDPKYDPIEGPMANHYSTVVMDQLFYKVQLGVYSRELDLGQYYHIDNSVNKEKLSNGMYKYTSGNYDTYAKANELKMEIRERGIGDAFVTPIYHGKRISMEDVKAMITTKAKDSATR